MPLVDGVGAARNRMNTVNPTVSLAIAEPVSSKFVWSSGVPL